MVKEDTGCKAVFAEDGALASHMTAATVSDTMSTRSGLTGGPNYAVSAGTQVTKKDASRLLKLLATESSTIRVRLPGDRRSRLEQDQKPYASIEKA